MPKILLPTGLYGQTGGKEIVSVPGATLDEALAGLAACCPEITKHLFRERAADAPAAAPALRSYVRAFIGDTDSLSLQGGATPVDEETEIRIVPSIAGGAPSGVSAPLGLDPATIELSQAEIGRYSRHLIMPEVAIDGQRRLKAASVLCIGTGGLGAPLVMYLAAAGVGRIGLVDFDTVDVTNLQRQVVHGTKDVGRLKIDSARETLEDINPEITIETHNTMLTSENALELFAGYDIIVDGTDNFPTRYLVNDACVLLGKPNVYGLDLPLRRSGNCLLGQRRPVLSLPVPGAAASRAGAVLRRRRRAGNSAGYGRLYSGNRSHKADPGHRRAANRPPAAFRRPRDAVQGIETPQRPGLPDLRNPPDDPRTD